MRRFTAAPVLAAAFAMPVQAPEMSYTLMFSQGRSNAGNPLRICRLILFLTGVSPERKIGHDIVRRREESRVAIIFTRHRLGRPCIVQNIDPPNQPTKVGITRSADQPRN